MHLLQLEGRGSGQGSGTVWKKAHRRRLFPLLGRTALFCNRRVCTCARVREVGPAGTWSQHLFT